MQDVKFKKTLLVIPAYNEENIIQNLINNVPQGVVDEILVVDDASSDKTGQLAKSEGVTVIRHAHRKGCGSSVRTGIDYALENNFYIIVIMAGNGKDNPQEIPRLIEAIVNGGYYFVQGSRYLKGGQNFNMPFHRKIGTRAYSFIFSVLVMRRITDGTNGFRAFKTELFKDLRINIWQSWLNNYEVESYLYCQVARLGYKFKEVPVTKTYPKDLKAGYTKMKPFSGWWSHFRPILLLSLGIKR